MNYPLRYAYVISDLGIEIAKADLPSAGPNANLTGMRKAWGAYCKPIRVGNYLYNAESRPDLWARASPVNPLTNR